MSAMLPLSPPRMVGMLARCSGVMKLDAGGVRDEITTLVSCDTARGGVDGNMDDNMKPSDDDTTLLSVTTSG